MYGEFPGGFIQSLKRLPDMGVDYAVELLGGSEELYEKLVKKAVRLLPKKIEQMDKALDNPGGIGEFAIVVHGVKSSLNQIGCRRLGSLAESLETEAKQGAFAYCAENYPPFKEELLRFYGDVNGAAAKPGGLKTGGGNPENISAHLDTLMKVQEYAEDYNAISALELLAPLTERSFGKEADMLISNSAASLDSFKYRIALEYISELLEKYGGQGASG